MRPAARWPSRPSRPPRRPRRPRQRARRRGCSCSHHVQVCLTCASPFVRRVRVRESGLGVAWTCPDREGPLHCPTRSNRGARRKRISGSWSRWLGSESFVEGAAAPRGAAGEAHRGTRWAVLGCTEAAGGRPKARCRPGRPHRMGGGRSRRLVREASVHTGWGGVVGPVRPVERARALGHARLERSTGAVVGAKTFR